MLNRFTTSGVCLGMAVYSHLACGNLGPCESYASAAPSPIRGKSKKRVLIDEEKAEKQRLKDEKAATKKLAKEQEKAEKLADKEAKEQEKAKKLADKEAKRLAKEQVKAAKAAKKLAATQAKEEEKAVKAANAGPKIEGTSREEIKGWKLNAATEAKKKREAEARSELVFSGRMNFKITCEIAEKSLTARAKGSRVCLRGKSDRAATAQKDLTEIERVMARIRHQEQIQSSGSPEAPLECSMKKKMSRHYNDLAAAWRDAANHLSVYEEYEGSEKGSEKEKFQTFREATECEDALKSYIRACVDKGDNGGSGEGSANHFFYDFNQRCQHCSAVSTIKATMN